MNCDWHPLNFYKPEREGKLMVAIRFELDEDGDFVEDKFIIIQIGGLVYFRPIKSWLGWTKRTNEWRDYLDYTELSK